MQVLEFIDDHGEQKWSGVRALAHTRGVIVLVRRATERDSILKRNTTSQIWVESQRLSVFHIPVLIVSLPGRVQWRGLEAIF